MRVLIASVTAGYGHHASADAIAKAFEAQGNIVRRIDALKMTSDVLYKTVDKGLLLALRVTPETFGRTYRNMENNTVVNKFFSGLMTSDIITERLLKPIRTFRPDVVITTHIFAAQIIDQLQRIKQLDVLHIGIITDYTIHPMYEDLKNIQKIVVCSPTIIDRAVRRGIYKEKLLPIGIPIKQEFFEEADQIKTRKKLGLHPDKNLVLVISGSTGYGDVDSVLKGLTLGENKNLQIVCICGKNKSMQKKLSNQAYQIPVFIYGFVSNMSEFLDTADIVVTKPGGLSITESLAKKKPIVIVNPIPGMEEENAEFLVNMGVALRAGASMPVHEIVNLLLNNPERRRILGQSIECFIQKNATQKLVEYVQCCDSYHML